MKSSERTDADLIKRARYGGRNVSGLAILASLLAGLLLVVLLSSPEDEYVGIAAIAGVCIAAGYWLLALATRQGETLGLSIIIGAFSIQFLLSLATEVFAHLRTAETNPVNLVVIAITLLIIVVLAGNRSDLIELHKRGLVETAIGPPNPVKNL